MAVVIEMPKPGVTVEECLLLRWLKKEGEPVAAGEAVAEIETDKATFEVPAPAGGLLLARFFEEGALVPVYTVMGVVGEPGEDIAACRRQAAPPADPTASAPRHTEPPRTPPPPPAAPSSPAAISGRSAASPRARRFAEEHRFPLAGVTGTGPGGRILEADVKRAFYGGDSGMPVTSAAALAASGAAAAALHAGPVSPPPVARAAGGVRERIARRMRESLAGTAQYTLHAAADARGLLALRARIKAARQGGAAVEDVNINDLVMFCAARALQRMPELNAHFIDGELRRHEEIHLGFACDTPRGLLVPVVKDCHKIGVEELSRRVRALSAQAVAGKISPDDLTGATFTVSNLGNLGIESFTPILNPPQVALLGVNAIQLRPVRTAEGIAFADYIGLSLTADHQVIDGAPGARFLQVLRECIENVESLAGLAL